MSFNKWYVKAFLAFTSTEVFIAFAPISEKIDNSP